MTAILFDIDGTIIESNDFDSKCYIRAIRDIFGDVIIHDDWNRYEKVTDLGILNQIMLENNIFDKHAVKKVKVGDHVAFHQIDTFDREQFYEWGISDAMFINKKEVNTGPPPSYEKIKKKISKELGKSKKQWWSKLF